jgi:hypothetical protein
MEVVARIKGKNEDGSKRGKRVFDLIDYTEIETQQQPGRRRWPALTTSGDKAVNLEASTFAASCGIR